MKLSWKARRRWALFILIIALPAYIMAAVTVMNWLDRPPFWMELVVYVGLGMVWIVPLKGLFRGISQPDPDQTR